MARTPLPIDDALPGLIDALRHSPAVVLEAPPGAGKTTRVPPALLDAGLPCDRAVVMLEPRRLAARAAASRIAFERGTRVGGEVGYHVRFDRRASRDTRLLVVTDGVFVRLLDDDPFLDRFGVVVLDEFHERGLDLDLALALVRRLQAEARPDLKLVVMSATLEATPLCAWLGDAPRVSAGGRPFPVTVEHVERPEPARVVEAAAERARDAARRTGGDVLVFLPGVGEIRRAARHLGELPGLRVVELYGDLPPERQDDALRSGGTPRVVLATNVAETSVTVEGVTAVVDAGLARVPRLDPGLGLPRLSLERISRASAEQRAGRAGRLGPGLCVRLWPSHEHGQLAERLEPEIRRVDLAAAVLRLLCQGESDVARFPWFEPPEPERLAHAQALLRLLDAVTGEPPRPTPTGRRLARLPVHPRVGRLLLEAHRRGAARRGALLAALLGERDLLPRGREAAHHSDSDPLDRVELFERGGARGGAAHLVGRARDQLARMIADELGPGPAEAPDSDEALLRAVLAGYPDRVAVRRAPGSDRGRMVGGRGIRLGPASAVRDAPLFVCCDLDLGPRSRRGDALVTMASAIDRAWIGDRLREEETLEFDAQALRVVATRRTLYEDLPIGERPVPPGDPAAVAALLADAAGRDLARALPLDDAAVVSWLGRVRALREWRPELELPAFHDEDLRAVLPRLCTGRRSFEELRRAPLLDALRGLLDGRQHAALEREAPERIEVPSGSRIRLAYEPGRPPVLAVRIQELFGLAETPRVAGGRVPVLLHLLAPNGRPQQVTDDLAGFWERTWPQVRRELRGRYPKHAWPEDPLAAEPQRRPRRRP